MRRLLALTGMALVLSSVVSVGLVAGVLVVVAPPASAVPMWSITPTVDASRIRLVGVSCPATASCFAVGYTDSATSVQHWNGRGWSIMPSPNPAGSRGTWLNAVSCANPKSCYAVGGVLTAANTDHGLVEHWDGSHWSIMPSPPPPGPGGVSLLSVSCPTTVSCSAVGIYITTPDINHNVAERWDGTRWSIVTSPTPTGGALAPEGLTSVSCVSPTSCFAVDSTFHNGGFSTLVEHWNGTRWSIVASPNVTSDSELSGVSCPRTNSCFAVGRYATSSTTKTLVEHWDGSRWSIVASPNVTSDTELSAVSCSTSSSCYAVGNSVTSSTAKTLVEHWNGSRWSIVATPNPTSATAAGLGEVSCPTAISCLAVGYSSKTLLGFGTTLVEQYR